MGIKKVNQIRYHDGTPLQASQPSPDDLDIELERATQAYFSHITQQDPSTRTSAPNFSDPFHNFVATSLNKMENRNDTTGNQFGTRFDNLDTYVRQEFINMDIHYQGLSTDIDLLTDWVKWLQSYLDDEDAKGL